MGQNGPKISFWPHKLTQRAYFGLEVVEQGWNTNEDIQTDQFVSFARLIMSQMLPNGDKKRAKID